MFRTALNIQTDNDCFQRENHAQNPSAAYRPALFGQILILPPPRTLVQTGTDNTARAFPVFTGYPSSGWCSSTISALRFSGGSRRKYFNSRASCGEAAPSVPESLPWRSHSALVSSHFASVSILSGVGIDLPTSQWWNACVLTG